MFKHYFEIIDGIDIYPVISLLIFFLFFISVTAYLFLVDNKYLREMSSLPLDNNESKSKTISETKNKNES